MNDVIGKLDRGTLRRFGLLVGGVFIGLFGILPLLLHRPPHTWPWIVGGILVVAGLVWPMGLKWVYVPWMYLGHALGWVNTRIILTLVFGLVFIPIGIGKRLLGRDSLERRFEPDKPTYRKPSDALPRTHMERPF